MAPPDGDPVRADARPAGVKRLTVPARAVPIFVFLHVPKTAGTTLRWVFNQMFGSHYHLYAEDLDDRRRADGSMLWQAPDYFDDKLLLGGHIGRYHPVVRAIRDRRIVFVTVLRDPVKRVVSYYDYLRAKTDHPLHPDVRSKSLLAAFAPQSRFRAVCEDEQLKLVFGAADRTTVDAQLAAHSFIIGRSDNLAALSDAVSAISGMPPVREIPRYNQREEHGASEIVLARDQPDFPEAAARIREANPGETSFFERFRGDLVVSTATRTPGP